MSPFTYSGTELEILGEAAQYYRWILGHFQTHLGKRVIEVGAGLGTFSEFLLNETSLSQLCLIEPDSENFSKLKTRYGERHNVEIRQGFLENHISSLRADSLVAVNVLEHVQDDTRFLRSAAQILVEDGTLLLFVPAVPWLYGSIDQAAGHFRRYDKASLRKKIEGAGFKLLHLSYFNFLGIFSWLLAGRVLRLRTLNRGPVLFYDRWIVPWLSAVERWWEPPLGQSLIAIAQIEK